MTTTAQRQHQKDALHREAVRLTLTANVERVLRERVNRDHWGYGSPACGGTGAEYPANRGAGSAETQVLASGEAAVRGGPQGVRVPDLDQFNRNHKTTEQP